MLQQLHRGSARLSDLVDGQLAKGLLAQGGGLAFYLDPERGNDADDGLSPETAFRTLPAAYAALRDGRQDVLFYIAGAGSVKLEASFTWSKSYAHLVGVCAPTQAGQRARIFQAEAAEDVSPLITISGQGCVFANLYIFQGVDDDGSLVNVRVSGQRNFFENVHFAGGGHASQAIDGGASLQISGGSENTFVRCTIGVDTIAAGAGMAALVFAATGGAARNRFVDCDFTLQAGHAGAIFVELLGNAGLDRYQLFRDCAFINLASTALTQAFAVAGGLDPANKRILLKDCVMVGAAKWDNGDSGLVYGNMGAVVADDLGGALVALQE
ncbi:MAG: hypothetical protein KIT46_04505 [Anaerolineales bacterium]|nr:hypothetical protein [Anaerolineales bacterium]MCW5855291.1 hypothetical protein [Anaerolineales bacterium]